MARIKILTQPDDVTCGPTCLHAIYQYYGDKISLQEVIKTVPQLEDGGGTLSALLGVHALKRGYNAKLYSYNLEVLDPTWFKSNVDIVEKLHQQSRVKTKKRLMTASSAYTKFLKAGGKLLNHELTPELLKSFFKNRQAVLAGLSATYLYRTAREHAVGNKTVYDDIKGQPCGHFVVLCGYDKLRRKVVVADPYRENPVSQNNFYTVRISRLVSAIMLGALTYDANILVIEPKK